MKKNVREREINLVILFWDILLKWRKILLCAVVVAAVLGGYRFYKDVKAIESAKSKGEIVLDESEQNQIKEYQFYQNKLKQQEKYNENAVLMNLDAEKYCVGTLKYYMSVGENITVETQQALVLCYQNLLQTEMFKEKVVGIIGGKTDIQYYDELVDCNNHISSRLGIEGNGENGVLEIVVRVQDKESCVTILEVIDAELLNNAQMIGKELESHKVVKVTENSQQIFDNELLEYQLQQFEKAVQLEEQVDALYDELSGKQQSYLEQQSKAGEDKKVENKPEAAQLSVKWLLLGFVLGGVLAVGILFITYVLNKYLRLEDDVEQIFGVKLLGCVATEESNKKKLFGFIDKAILKLKYANVQIDSGDKSLSMIATNIGIACEREGKNKVTVTSNTANENEVKMVSELKNILEKMGVQAEAGNSILQDCNMLQNAADTSMIVLVEGVGNVGYNTIQKEIDVCKQQGTKIVGMIVVAG